MESNVVPELVSMRGKGVMFLQKYHVRSKSVTFEVSMEGNVRSPAQDLHVPLIVVALEVSIAGKEVRPLQPAQHS